MLKKDSSAASDVYKRQVLLMLHLKNGYSISSILTIIPKTVLLVIMIGLSMIR